VSSVVSENDVRLFVYRRFVSACRAPTIAETAEAFGMDRERMLEIFEGLEQGHVFVLEPDTRQIRMAMPFSAVPTSFKVTSGAFSWWAN
jgi:hypothetical protein